MRRITHWSLNYINSRISQWADQKKYPDDPWLTRQSIDTIDSYLRDRDIGVEWGSGRSTLWFSKRVHQLISVEDNVEWYNNISNRLKNDRLENVEYHLESVEKGQDVLLQSYVRAPLKVPDNSLNFALIDGKFRDGCAVSVIEKLIPGGILIIDNIELYLPSKSISPLSIGPNQPPVTKLWREFANKIRDWRSIWTTNGVTDTCIWIKPCEHNG